MKTFFSKRENQILAVLVAVAVCVFLFVITEVAAFTETSKIKPFTDVVSVDIVKEEELMVSNENLEIAASMGEVHNVTRDNNDTRRKSNENWSENKATISGDPVKAAKDFERELFNESGGYREREKIQQEMEARKNAREKQKVEKNGAGGNSSSQNGNKPNQFAGNVMVDFSLSGRTAYDNNNWYVRNPGYTCGYGSAGTVVVKVSVDKTGKVIATEIDESKSGNANVCMRDQALKYAAMSRFNYTDSAPSRQEGYIRYRFVSQ